MWSLIPFNKSDEGPPFRLLVGKKYTLGRQNADFIINNDKSISRIHATLEVTHPDTNVSHPHKPPVFTVRDSSKFGTIIRDEKFVNAEHLVKNGDTVKFGTVTSVYSAVYSPYVVTTSCLDQPNKRQTKALITKLGGHVVSDWRKECQLLIMTSLSVTVKVICALVSLKPIVTVQYLEKLAEIIESGSPPPNPDEFTPPLAESQLNPNEVSFKKDARRGSLFQGKVFIFLNPKQFKKLNVAVELAGGTPMLMEEGTDDNTDDILVRSSTCVMHADPNDTASQLSQNAHDWVRHVLKVLKKHGRRAIPDCELGFAVLYCSTDRYCNPSIDALPAQAANIPSQTLSQQVAPQSMSQIETTSQKQEKSASSVDRFASRVCKSGPSTSKGLVKVKEEPESQPQPKTIAAQPQTSSSKKRPREDEDEDLEVKTAKIPKIKEETIPPSKSSHPKRTARRSPSPSPQPTTPVRSAQAKSPESCLNSPSPSPPHQNNAQAVRSRGGKQPIKHPESPTPRRSPRSRSPSPAPQKTASQSVSPVRRSGRCAGSSRSPSPAPSPVPSPKSEPMSDELDEFDAFKPRSRRKRSPVSTRDTKPQRHSPSTERSKVLDKATNQSNITSHVKKSPKRRVDDTDDFDISPVVEDAPRSITKPKPSHHLISDDDNDEVMVNASRKPPVSHHLLDGFLTTRLPIKDQVDASDVARDEDVPSNVGTVIVAANLTVPRRPRPAVIAENNNTINGKVVKNFKKFKKVMGAGATGLPRIIGGTDLRPHLNDARKVDAWFEEEREEEQKKAEEDKVADDLFNWNPTKLKKKPVKRR